MAEMTLDEMKAVIDAGGSVLVRKGNGKVLATRHEHLPSEAELAKGDPAKEAAAREALDARIKLLQAERDGLSAATFAVSSPAPSVVGELGPARVFNPDLVGREAREREAADAEEKSAPRKDAEPEKKPAPLPEPKKPETKGK
jgi:hypothetical protein